MNVANIITGWSKSMGMLEISPEEQAMSVKRLEQCGECPAAKESSFLKIIKGEGRTIDAMYCTLCSCPCNEKSLVKNETCPLGKW